MLTPHDHVCRGIQVWQTYCSVLQFVSHAFRIPFLLRSAYVCHSVVPEPTWWACLPCLSISTGSTAAVCRGKRDQRAAMVWRALLEREQLGSPEQQLRCVASHSTALVERMRLQRSLKGHDGCVNTCSFTPNGDSLLSGSDDLAVIMWDWEAGEWRFMWVQEVT